MTVFCRYILKVQRPGSLSNKDITITRQLRYLCRLSAYWLSPDGEYYGVLLCDDHITEEVSLVDQGLTNFQYADKK